MKKYNYHKPLGENQMLNTTNKALQKLKTEKTMKTKSLVYALIVGFILLTNTVSAALEDHFVIKVQPNISGPSTQFTIPTSGGGYNYRVDWDNDGTFDDIGVTGDISHVYSGGFPLIHTIRIAGDFPRIFFNNIGDKDKIISIDQWGTIPWGSMESAFTGCTNLVMNATDNPNFSSTLSLSKMFRGATNIGAGIGTWNWDTSNITDMSGLFRAATSFDEDISSWDFESVLNMSSMFQSAGLSTINYEALLIRLHNQNLALNTTFNAGDSKYCSSQGRNARLNLTLFDGYTINDGGLCEAGYFITSWRLNDASLPNPTSVTIPTNTGLYHYQVDWNGDGDFDDDDEDIDYAGDATHDFGTLSVIPRTIKIKGLFPQIYFNNLGDRRKILNIDQWGTNRWLTMENAFHGALNVRNLASDEPDLSNVTSLDFMFRNASSLGTNLENGNWDWDVSTITSMDSTFLNATVFEQDLSSWDVSNLGNAFGMFGNVTLPTALYDLLLVNWDMRNLQSSVTFSGGNSIFCSQAAQDAKLNMVDVDLWNISDGGVCSVNQPPHINETAGTVVENSTTMFGSVSATDPEGDSVTFSITNGGVDGALFTIGATSGVLNFLTAPDYENPTSQSGSNSYLVEITATDDGVPVESDSVILTIFVTDVVEDRIFMDGFE